MRESAFEGLLEGAREHFLIDRDGDDRQDTLLDDGALAGMLG